MKIIKQGVLPETKVLQLECGNCKAIIEVTQGELNQSFPCTSSQDQREASMRFVECPCCKLKIWTSIS